MHVTLTITTTDGAFAAHYSELGLAALDFPADGSESSRRESSPAALSSQIRHWHEHAERALGEALAGRTPGRLPPLDLSSGTEFQRLVWNALLRIPTGGTRSYAEIASEIGKPGATRAVGGACGANPIPIFIPCHRVLAANRRLGGFSGGLDWKRRLLAREGLNIT